ncbi:MAG: agmatine deiminase family protein [Pseudomonadota bacterium]
MSRRAAIKGAAGVAALAGLAARVGMARADTGAVDTSAKAAGFFVPDEAHPHERTFMQWPVSRTVYGGGRFLARVQDAIADLANTISAFEPVVMLAEAAHHGDLRTRLSNAIDLWDIPTDDLWCRDSGPVFVINGRGGLGVTHLNFNGWGGKQVHREDGQIARRVAERLRLELFDNGLVGEGGGIEQDGDGTLLAHASSWVNPNRNSGTRDEIGDLLCDTFGADRVIWAPGLIGEDITDYHIDALARVIAPGRVLIQLPERVIDGDPWSAAAYETFDVLAMATDARGRSLNITVIPDPINIRVGSPDFVASYANYYVCNGGVICAEFGDPDTDTEVVQALAALYPDREVVALNADMLGRIGGGIHCATQQQPMA